LQPLQLNSQCTGRNLYSMRLRRLVFRLPIPENGYPVGRWHRFFYRCHPFSTELRCQTSHSRDVSTRPLEACDKSSCNWVTDVRYHDGDCFGRAHGGIDGWRVRGDDHVNREPNHLGGILLSCPDPQCKSGLKNDVLSLDVANPSQALAERFQDTRVRVLETAENTDPRDFRGLLCSG